MPYSKLELKVRRLERMLKYERMLIGSARAELRQHNEREDVVWRMLSKTKAELEQERKVGE